VGIAGEQDAKALCIPRTGIPGDQLLIGEYGQIRFFTGMVKQGQGWMEFLQS